MTCGEPGNGNRLQQLASQYETNPVVTGMAHLQRIRTFYSQSSGIPLERTSQRRHPPLHLHPDSAAKSLENFLLMSAICDLRRAPLAPEPPRENIRCAEFQC